MTITITLPLETEERLRAQAKATGQDITVLVIDALNEKLGASSDASASIVPYEQWRADFGTWIASHASRNPSFDDNRETIYD
jgi:hypothetical protein